MAYISPDGTVHNSQPWGLSKLSNIFLGIINAIFLFFYTLIPGNNDNSNAPYSRPPGRGSGGGGGGGGGGSGGSGPGYGPPRPPPRPRGNFHTFSDTFGRGSMNVPGGCSSCG